METDSPIDSSKLIDAFSRFVSAYPGIEVFCFDFFDTLVTRTVEPETTKKIASRQLGTLLGREIAGEMIYQLRRDLEAKLCRENAEKGNDPEFNFLEFALAFHALMKEEYPHFPGDLQENDFSRRILDIELATEKLLQRVNPEVKNLLVFVSQNKARIAVVSDFYVPAAHFGSFLDCHGMSGHVEQLFISADFGLKKSSGRLYDKMIEHYGCPPEKMLMVGDNAHSDIRMAREKGILTFQVPPKRVETRGTDAPARKVEPLSPQEIAEKMSSFASRLGGSIFPEMGLTLYRFVFLLFRELAREKIDRICFFSKEGEFLKALFDRFQEERFGKSVIASHYLLVSRKSTYLCSLKPLAQESFNGIFQQYRHISPREFMLSLSFTDEEAEGICGGLSIGPGDRVPDFQNSPQFQSLLEYGPFRRLYESKRTRQKNVFLRYLESFGTDFYEKCLTIVDVGWKGSIQDNLFHILDGKVRIRGYYIGLLNPTSVTPLNSKKGILFANAPRPTPFFEVYRSNTSLFEMLLGATHGSADGYEEGAGDGRAGSEVRVLLSDTPEERALYREKIQPVQARIAEVFGEINRMACVTQCLEPDDRWYAQQHARMVFRPTRGETLFFKGLYHRENFGVFEFTRFEGRNPLSLERRWSHFKQVLQEPKLLSEKGIWHPVLLDRLGIGFAARFFGENRHRKAFPESPPVFRFTGERLFRALSRLNFKRGIKIAFFLGVPEISGGTYVIFEHAVRLNKKGYKVFILTREQVQPERYSWHPEAGTLEWLTLDEAVQERFDFAIATWWQSALLLNRVRAQTYLYFVQSVESRFFPGQETATAEERAYRRLVESTYLLPLPVITEAGWIRDYLNEKFGIEPFVVRNGVRKDLYTEAGDAIRPREKGKLRVLVEGPMGVPFKNVEKALALARESEADDVWLLTPTETGPIEGVSRIFSRVPIRETAPVYRSCDVLLKLSTVEGMFGPPLEMFHCGGTAIVYDVTGHEEYIRHNVNSFVLPAGDEAGVVHHLNLLKRSPDILERLKEGARATASGWPDWDRASDRFEKALRKIKGRRWPNRAYLSEASAYLYRNCENDIRLFFEMENAPTLQSCQVYWHQGDGYSEAKSLKNEYRSGEWVSIGVKLHADAGSLHLRVDPCMWDGVVFVGRIEVADGSHERALARFGPDSGWNGLTSGGTASAIHAGRFFAIESTGADPQILVPLVQIDGSHSLPAEIRVEIDLKFIPHKKALDEILADLRACETVSTERDRALKG